MTQPHPTENAAPDAVAATESPGSTGAGRAGVDGPDGLLLVLPQLFHRRDGVLEVEAQGANGLRLYREHFDRVTVAAGCLRAGAPLPPSLLGVPADAFAAEHGVGLVPLLRLDGYRQGLRDHGLGGVRRARREVAERLGTLIDRHAYLQFTPSRHADDWGSLAADLAAQRGRPYAIYTDRVQEQMVLDEARGRSLPNRLRARVYHHLLRRRRHRAIRGAELGMFHGADCHAAYRGMSAHTELVHDVHTRRGDAIGDEDFEAKLAAAADPGTPLRVVYAGRVDPDKGPLDFAEAVAAAVHAGADVRATWHGDGTLMRETRSRCASLGLGDRLRLPGFTADREALLAALRENHLMMFCHKVPESPRCLIEALVSGTPLLGYASAFSADLIGEGDPHREPAGLHVARHDHAALARELVRLAADRGLLLRLMEAARQAGRGFNDAAVFTHRCEALKARLSHPGPRA